MERGKQTEGTENRKKEKIETTQETVRGEGGARQRGGLKRTRVKGREGYERGRNAVRRKNKEHSKHALVGRVDCKWVEKAEKKKSKWKLHIIRTKEQR